jgi:hypothetical protein
VLHGVRDDLSLLQSPLEELLQVAEANLGGLRLPALDLIGNEVLDVLTTDSTEIGRHPRGSQKLGEAEHRVGVTLYRFRSSVGCTKVALERGDKQVNLRSVPYAGPGAQCACVPLHLSTCWF